MAWFDRVPGTRGAGGRWRGCTLDREAGRADLARTRRRIDGPDTARRLSRDLAIPVYDARVTGYPQRMREYRRDGRPGQPATSASIVARRVRTGTPVPPLGV